MPGHFDALETRSPDEREHAQFSALPAQVARAKSKAAHYARLLERVDAAQVDSRAALAKLPVTRKSAQHEMQRSLPPFGGLNATPPGGVARIFMSPGPIYEPEGRGEDPWRTARALFAAGFRAGDVAIN